MNYDILQHMIMELRQEQRARQEQDLYHQEYSSVINSSITPENIQTFHNETLNKLIEIVNKITSDYKNNHKNISLTGKELEDVALKETGLQDITSVLDIISTREMDLRNLEKIILSQVSISPNIFVPPTADEKYTLMKGSEKGILEKALIPRLLTFLYILENDLSFNIEEENTVEIVKGEVSNKMMRKQPYFRVSIPSLERLVYVCEEEGNATFIFDTNALHNYDLKVEVMDTTDKSEFKKLINENNSLGICIRQSKYWRAEILEALNNDFTLTKEGVMKSKVKPKSDFEPKEEATKKKDGWESANSLIKISKSDKITIKKYTEQFRESNPEWFEIQKTGPRSAEHYSPDLVTKIIEHFTSTPNKKDGWESANSLGKICKSGNITIKKYADSYKKDYPAWFEIQKNKGPSAEHYSPDLVAKIIEHFTSTPEKKDGWESANSLGKICKSGIITIKKYADSYKKDYPAWFEIQKNKGPSTEYYSPDLVAKIIEHFGEKK